MKLKINWGTGILITIILFIASVLIQVFFYMKMDVDLVTDNYYEKELKYEDHLASVRNSNTLKSDIGIVYSGNEININFPGGYIHDKIKGSLLFYRPSDSSKDFMLMLRPDNNGLQKVSTSNLASGYWRLKMNWQYEDKLYYYEKSILIN